MAKNDPRLTQRALLVLRYLLNDHRGRSGADISRATKVGPGTLYPMLARLEGSGWLSSGWEAIDPTVAGRPRRRFYKLTGVGQRKACAALADLQIAEGEPVWVT